MVSVEDPTPGVTRTGRRSNADQSSSGAPFRTAWTVIAAALAAAGVVSQLVTDGTGQILLGIVGLAAIVALGLQAARVRDRKHARLALDLAAATRANRLYRSAIRRIIARQFDLFEETVEILVTIGGRDGQDTIVERHRTTPKTALPYRLIRPITASTSPVRPGFAEIGLTIEIDGEDIDAQVLPLAEDAEGVQIMILFTPGLIRPTEWSLSYRAPRLWDVLRQDGFDRLGWAPSDRDGRESAIAVTDLTVHFVFPPDTHNVGVREQDGRGGLSPRTTSTGERRVTWRDENPTVQPYKWELWWSGGQRSLAAASVAQ
jgi:hypothetical protein